MIQENRNGPDPQIPPELALAFAPLHKRAFGLAVGISLGGCLFLATLYCTVVPGYPDFMNLIGNYFPGYTVSLEGAFIGLGWGTFAFFVAGWFCAFCRNLAIATNIWLARTRDELYATRDFLDHI